MRRLTRVSIDKLLDRFDHKVDFPSDWPFVIIHGPNGVGKTKLLELVTYALSLDSTKLLKLPFKGAILDFDDGYRLELQKLGTRPADRSREPANPGSMARLDNVEGIRYKLFPPKGKRVEWLGAPPHPNQRRRIIHLLEREAPVLRSGPDVWRDLRVGDTIATSDVISRYGDLVNPGFGVRQLEIDAPSELRKFCNETNVHLIETQRLTSRDSSDELRRGARDVEQRLTVVHYAEDLRERLQRALADNSRTTQRLDRTFPRRILEGGASKRAVTEDAIRDRYEQQSIMRNRLSRMAVLEERQDLPLPDRKLEDWERGVLWTYLDDTEQKLATFASLLERVDALRRIVNSRFLFKEVVIDSEVGFRFITDTGRELNPASLSSGEQHELILVYNLLFNAPSDSLVLIDEPEISLHISWQQNFLADMVTISKIASLRFILATHSPSIIGKWWNRTVRLASDPADVSDD